jgi:hypothetical protein
MVIFKEKDEKKGQGRIRPILACDGREEVKRNDAGTVDSR